MTNTQAQDNIHEKIWKEQVNSLVSRSHMPGIGGSIAAIAVAYLLQEQMGPTLTLFWLIPLVALNSYSLALKLRFTKQSEPNLKHYYLGVTTHNIFASLLWGIMPILTYFHSGTEQLPFAVMVIIGVSSTAMVGAGAVLFNLLILYLLAVIPTALMLLFFVEGHMWTMIGYLLVLYFFTAMGGSLTFHKMLLKSIRIGFEMENAKKEAELANEAKSSFLANMSHEIRTPLTPIIGYAQMIDSDIQAGQVPDRENSRSILRNSKHLLSIINDLLDLSKIESNHISMEELDIPLPEFLHDIEVFNIVTARRKGLDFSINYQFPLPLKIQSDPTRLRQVIFNLISNAIKFTHEGSIDVDVTHDKEQQLLFVSVKDSGIGIEADNLEKLFKPFSQADASTTRKYGGTGLGLTISKKLAQMLGGDLTVSSSPNQGSTFTLSIKTGNVEQLVDKFEKSSKPASSEHKPDIRLQGKVLVADDSQDVQNLLRVLIKKRGADVTVVENGKQAIDCASKEDFDLILMDWQMPVLDGVNATAQLRKSGYTLPIVALSASTMKAERENFINAGADLALAKPIDIKTLNQVLQQFLKTAESAKAV